MTLKAGKSDCSWLMLWGGNARQEFVTKVTDTIPSTLLPSLNLKLSMEILAALALAEISGLKSSLHFCSHSGLY